VRYYLAIFTTIAFYSTVEVITKKLGAVDPNLLAFLRFFPSGVIILLIGRRHFKHVRPRDLLWLALLGVVGITLTFTAYHGSLAMKEFPASTGAVIFSINPVFSMLTAWLLLRERLSIKRVVGVLFGLVGVYVVSFGFERVTFASAKAPLLMFGAQVCFGVYVAAAKRYVFRYGPFFVNGVIFIVGSVLFLPMIGQWHVPTDPVTLWWLVYLALLATGLAYVLYFYGLNKVPIAAGTSIFYLKPVLAPLLAAHVLHDKLGLNFFLGLAIIFVSLALTISGRRRGARHVSQGSA